MLISQSPNPRMTFPVKKMISSMRWDSSLRFRQMQSRRPPVECLVRGPTWHRLQLANVTSKDVVMPVQSAS